MGGIDWSKVKFVKEIPKGAKQLHLYDVCHVLRPRGHMEKESLGAYILEKLLNTYESWTNPKYGDNPDKSTLLKLLQQNMKDEVDGAWREFIKQINTHENNQRSKL
jgi:hypothetical protein